MKWMHLSRASFDRLVEEAIASLPPEFARWLDDVPVIVEDRPAAADRAPGEDADPLGLFVGPGLGEESAGLPPRIMLYRRPLLEACASRAQLAREIRKTLIHELGHYAGMDEDDLERHGFGAMESDDSIDWEIEE